MASVYVLVWDTFSCIIAALIVLCINTLTYNDIYAKQAYARNHSFRAVSRCQSEYTCSSSKFINSNILVQ